MNLFKFSFTIVIGLSLFYACAGSNTPQAWAKSRREPDVVLRVSPIRVKPLQAKAVVDAIEPPEDGKEPKALVLFRIERVLRGTLPQTKVVGPSKWEQAQDAVKDKDFLKVLTADFSNPESSISKEWLSIAVADPAKTFQIPSASWDNPVSKSYQIRIQPVAGRTGSYVMVESRIKK